MSDFVLGKRFMGLFIGKPKTSKTVQAASWVYAPTVTPDRRVLLIDLDGRAAPIAQFYPGKLDLIERKYYAGKDFEKLLRDFENLQDNCPYDTIIFDGLTMLGEHLISYMIGLRGGGGVEKGKKRGVLELAGVEDFGGEARGMSLILQIAAVIPCNFIMTAHYIVVENTNVMTGKTTTTKQLCTAGKKVAARVPINFDEIYFFEKQQSMTPGEAPRFLVKTQGDEESFAGTVLPLPHTIDVSMKPGDKGLYDKIQKAMKESMMVKL
jgi:hypothetical protein